MASWFPEARARKLATECRVMFSVRTASAGPVAAVVRSLPGHAQRVPQVGLVRIREARNPVATKARSGTLVRVGHDCCPARRPGRAVRESSLIHVAVAVRKCIAAWGCVPVMMKSHVVPELVRERHGIALSTCETKSARDVYRYGNLRIGDQVNEVCSGLVSHGVDFVHVAVRWVSEPLYILERIAGLGVLDLFPGHQDDLLIHAAVHVGLVGLGDHEVYHRFHLRGSASDLARCRGINDRDVDHRHRCDGASARQPRGGKLDCRQPRLNLRILGHTDRGSRSGPASKAVVVAAPAVSLRSSRD